MLVALKSCLIDSFTPPIKALKDSRLSGNKRIEWIDLAKGVCILLVVLFHFSEKWFNIPNLVALRMPLYFTLSGLFYKSYGDLRGYLYKKANNILIPYLFWFFVGLIFAIFLDYDGFIECESYRELQDQNGPIWFLLGLFNANLVFYLLQYYLKGYKLLVGVCVVASIGIYVSMNNIELPFEIDRAWPLFPFFYMGYMLKDALTKLEDESGIKFLFWGMAAIVISYAVYYTSDYLFENNVNVLKKLLSYVNSAFYVIGFMLICKVILWLPIISYIGRHSIIVLCTHWLNMRLLYWISDGPVDHWVFKAVFLFCLLLSCWIAIPLCKKYLPYFVAQKPLIKPKEDKISVKNIA